MMRAPSPVPSAHTGLRSPARMRYNTPAWAPPPMAGFDPSTYGRFQVSTEAYDWSAVAGPVAGLPGARVGVVGWYRDFSPRGSMILESYEKLPPQTPPRPPLQPTDPPPGLTPICDRP